MNYIHFEIIAAIIISCTMIAIVIKKPKLFWPLLIIANIAGNGPRLMGYIFWDELLTGSIVIGAFLRMSTAKTENQKNNSSHHKLIFAVWVVYMIIESVIGIAANNDLRIIRWTLFYCLLWGLSYILSLKNSEFAFPSVKHFSVIVLTTIIVYYSAYLLHGIIIESILEMPYLGRFSAQFLEEGFLWSGSATAVFPALIAMPAALFVIDNDKFKIRILAWTAVIFMMTVGWYYDSRITWVVIFSVMLVSIKKIKFKTIIIFIVILLGVFIVFVPSASVDLFYEYLYDTFKSTQALWDPTESDLTRQLQFEAGFLRLIDNAKTFFIGDGIYSHRVTIIPYIDALHTKYITKEGQYLIPGHKEKRDDLTGQLTIFRTTAFSALLVDTGIIGMFLFTLLFVMTIYKLTIRRGGYKVVLMVVCFLAYMWMFNNNISEIILLYLFIMPYGIIEQLSRSTETYESIYKGKIG